jgi:flagellar biogenesis protein FliO
MFETLFGAEMPLALRFFIAFIIVLGLIGGTAYVVRRFGAERLGGGSGRGRPPRLAVIDAAAVDGRRRLILIRRDNVEHLLMIGGPSDVVVEPNIVRAAAAPREAAPQRPPAAPEPLPRAVPLGEGTMWPLQPHVEPAAPPPPPRQQRPAPIHEEPAAWPMEPETPPPTPPPRQARPLDPLAGLAAELSRVPIEPEPSAPPPARPVREAARATPTERPRSEPRIEPRSEPRSEPRMEPRAEPQPSADQPFASGADQNLAEMAQRLEAALRRPAKSRDREPPRSAAEPAPELEIAPEPAPPPLPEPKPTRMEARAARADTQKPQGKSLYDSLEQEMASLLGRPNSKS